MSVQSISRAVSLLRALAGQSQNMGGFARNPDAGRSLGSLADDTGLDKATAHRLLKALREEGFVEHDPKTRCYRLGLDLVILATSAATRDLLADYAASAMRIIAEETADTVFLSIRHGFDAVCMDRLEGAFPIKSLPLNIGSRRPLGIGAGSLALLAFQPDSLVERAIAAGGAARLQFGPFDDTRIRRMVRETREQAFALNPGETVAGMSAVGVPVFDPAGNTVAALSAAAINERLSGARILEVASILQAGARRITESLNARRPGRTDEYSTSKNGQTA